MVRNNVHYYPIFEEINVYDNFYYIDDIDSYFDVANATHSDSYRDENGNYDFQGKSLNLKTGVVLKGKITLPVIYKDKETKKEFPIISLGEFTDQTGITHIYFQKRRNKEDIIENVVNEIRNISIDCFNGCSNLKIFEWPPTLRHILSRGFANCLKLTSTRLPAKVTLLGESCFLYAFAPDKTNPKTVDIYLPGTIRSIG